MTAYFDNAATTPLCAAAKAAADDAAAVYANPSSLHAAGLAAEKLLAAGALDVWTAPVYMKKQRPGVVLSVLCREKDRAELLRLLLTETTTFGVRERTVDRTVLRRDFATAETPYGPVRVKQGWLGDELVTASPEWEDCRAAAEKSGVPAKEVYRTALK